MGERLSELFQSYDDLSDTLDKLSNMGLITKNKAGTLVLTATGLESVIVLQAVDSLAHPQLPGEDTGCLD